MPNRCFVAQLIGFSFPHLITPRIYPASLDTMVKAYEEVVQRHFQRHLPNYFRKAPGHHILLEDPLKDRERGLGHPPPSVSHPPLPGLRVPKLLHDSHFPGMAATGPVRGVPTNPYASLDALRSQEREVEAGVVCVVTQNPNRVASQPGLLHQRHQQSSVARPLVGYLQSHDLLRLHIHDKVDLEEPCANSTWFASTCPCRRPLRRRRPRPWSRTSPSRCVAPGRC